MFTTSVREILGTDRDVAGAGWRSRRLVLARDGLPFSVHETTIEPGSILRLRYAVHGETVYCIQGTGTIEDTARGKTAALEPGGCTRSVPGMVTWSARGPS